MPRATHITSSPNDTAACHKSGIRCAFTNEQRRPPHSFREHTAATRRQQQQCRTSPLHICAPNRTPSYKNRASRCACSTLQLSGDLFSIPTSALTLSHQAPPPAGGACTVACVWTGRTLGSAAEDRSSRRSYLLPSRRFGQKNAPCAREAPPWPRLQGRKEQEFTQCPLMHNACRPGHRWPHHPPYVCMQQRRLTRCGLARRRRALMAQPPPGKSANPLRSRLW